MRLGYACVCEAEGIPHMRSCRMIRAKPANLLELLRYNLQVLHTIMEYNHAHDIHLFRISSGLLPFGSSLGAHLAWEVACKDLLLPLRRQIVAYGMRVTMHPGQYMILNTPHADVLSRSIADLEYHTRVLDALHVGKEGKIILHGGGVYQDKKAAMERFVRNFYQLPKAVRQRLVIENDERYYDIEAVLELAKRCQIPVVFDTLHHQLHPPATKKSEAQWIKLCMRTWQQEDGPCKLHYSEQAEGKRPGAHSTHIHPDSFLSWCRQLPDPRVDIMLEVKDKNASVLACQAVLQQAGMLMEAGHV